MAILAKHGSEVYRYNGIAYRLSFRSDGEILRNSGSGWKLWKRVKAGVNPAEYANRQRERHAAMDERQPLFCAFRSLMEELVPFGARYWVLEALKLLPGDPDGLCVELAESTLQYSDDNPDLSIDDCVKLCQAYQLAEEEAQRAASVDHSQPPVPSFRVTPAGAVD